MQVVSKRNAEHYLWSEVCDGWRLLDHPEMTVIQERMPPSTAEVPHFHRKARQFFFVLSGELIIELDNVSHTLKENEGLHLPPLAVHHVRNKSAKECSFLVFSAPKTRNDKVVVAASHSGQPSVVITYLQMLNPAELRPKRIDDSRFSIREAITVQWQLNRFMYLLVGEAWSWKDKANWTDDQWKAYAESPNLRTFTAAYDGSPAGYFELMSHADGSVEVAYFGLTQPFIDRGLGGPLLTAAIEESWRMNPSRVWVHTCTLDHPAALKNYLARGFKIYA